MGKIREKWENGEDSAAHTSRQRPRSPIDLHLSQLYFPYCRQTNFTYLEAEEALERYGESCRTAWPRGGEDSDAARHRDGWR